MASYPFTCKNPSKYAGDARRIVARSRWELAYMNALDTSHLVHKWISEPKNLNISYLNPIDKQLHRYWPDFLVQYVDGSVELLEIKPMKETVITSSQSTYDKLMVVKNAAKWQAADKFAKSIGGKFRVVTEQQLIGNRSTRRPKAPKGARRARGTKR